MRNNDDDIKKAKFEIERAKLLAFDDMPKVFIGINEALIYVRENNFDKAYDTIIKHEHTAEHAKFARIKQKYYITKAFIAWLSAKADVGEIIEIAKRYPDRRRPDKTEKICEKLLTNNKSYTQKYMKDYIIPSYLEYWYINPLKFMNLTLNR